MRRRYHAHPRVDAAAILRRALKSRGVILSESNRGDVDVKIEDARFSDGVGDVGGGSESESAVGESFRRRLECPVCWEHEKAVALQCGHQCCHRCAQFLKRCHSCRSEVLLKIKLF